MTAADSPPSPVGRQLGAYRLDAPIGAGGMGEVYRAKDTRLGRDVALKILPAAFAADPQRRSRFEREARAVAALNHPNICTIHDVGHDQGIDFLVMELVDGESLAARLAKGPLPLDEALARAMEIADALDKAHGQGIIHRDLKPGNVMLAKSGSGKATHVKLLDFGLARIVQAAVGAGVSVPTDTSPMTEAGALLGTLQYMAPEQIEGQPADARTDVFAFGALFYEMLTGRRAFEGSSTAAVMAAILREEPTPVDPPGVGRIVRRCLAKDPIRRYQSARDLLNDLAEVRESLASGQSEPRNIPLPQRRRRASDRAFGWLALGVAVVAIGIAASVTWNRPTIPATFSGRLDVQPPDGVAILPSQPRSVLAISPDGQWVAFRGFDSRTRETALYLRSIGELGTRMIARQGHVPFFSPDSRWLGFLADSAMFRVPVGAGRRQPICELPEIDSVRGASWGDDGTIVFTLDRALWRVPSEGGAPTRLTSPASGQRHYWPHALPGSAAAVFTINQGYNDRWRTIASVSLKTGEVRVFPALSGTAPRYVRSGHLVYSRFGALHAIPFDLPELAISGEAVKILDDVNTHFGSGSVAFDVSTSGSLVYIPGADRVPESELVWLDREGNAAPLVQERRAYLGAAVDPSGKRLAVAIADELGEADLSVYEIDRRAWTDLTEGMHLGSQLVWSPDGNWIFFTSFKSGEAELYRTPSREGSPEQLTWAAEYWEHPSSVSPDGKTLFFWRTETSQSDLMTLNLEPRARPNPFTKTPQFFEAVARISPDGRWVAYESDESGGGQVHVRPLPGPGRSYRVSAVAGRNPWWSTDGRELFYQRGAEIWAVPVEPGSTFRPGAPRMLFSAEFLSRPDSLVMSGHTSERFMAIRSDPPPRRVIYVPNWLEELRQTFTKAK
ncbi:MAG TPA: protein kinase [Vicinamibacterales bacterium]|nr:protein kinase [Vicinamibacterales bacterium]